MNNVESSDASMSYQGMIGAILISIGAGSVLYSHGGTYEGGFGILFAIILSFFLLGYFIYQVGKTKMCVGYSSLAFMPYWIYLLVNTLALSLAPWHGMLDVLSFSASTVIFLVVVNAVKGEWSKRVLLILFLLFAVVNGAFGFYQSYGDHNWHPVDQGVLAKYAGRAVGFFGQPNGYAGYLSLVVPIPAYVMLRPKYGMKSRIAALIVLMYLLWALMLGISRGAMIATIPVLISVGIFARTSGKARFLSVLFLLSIYFAEYKVFEATKPRMGDRVELLVASKGESGRRVYFKSAAVLFKQHPVVGVGGGSFEMLWDRQFPVSQLNIENNVHSDPLETLAETGIIGFVLLYGVIGLIWFSVAVRLLKERGESCVYTCVALSAVLGMVIHSAVDFPFKSVAITVVTMTYLGLLAQRLNWGEWEVTSFMRKSVLGCFVCLMCLVLALGVRPAIAVKRYAEAFSMHMVIGEALAEKKVPTPEFVLDTRREYLEVLEMNPSHVPALYNLAKINLLYSKYDVGNQKKHIQNSLELIDSVISLNPNNWRYWAERGEILDQIEGRREDARESYLRALEMAPEHMVALWMYVSHLSMREEDYPEARRVVDRMVELFPHKEKVHEIKENIYDLFNEAALLD